MATNEAPAPAKTPRAITNIKRKTPVRYSKKVCDAILSRLAEGERWNSMASKKGMPAYNAPYAWAKTYPDFRQAWAEAHRMGANARADMVVTVAEGSTRDTVQSDRLHVSALKWHVERDAKVWGLREDEPDLGAGRQLIIEVRRFELYTDEAGVSRVREVLPDARRGDEAGR